ncbi:MAG: ribonuclease III [Bacteroidales bacterium]|nr:ribonuclease III [Bacteroidales bacterium]
MWFWQRRKEDDAFDRFFKNILGFHSRKRELYQLAFIHRSKSIVSMHGEPSNNERLEYLGDAVLGVIVADYLYKLYPNADEGFLTETRSKIVSRANLGQVARKIGLLDLVQYDRESPGLFKSMGGDAFEALVGAMYIDKGYQFTRNVIVSRILTQYVDVEQMAHTEFNYKGKIIDWGQKNRHKVVFELVRTISYGRHSRNQYECRVAIDGSPAESAIDYSIKAAEQRAAEKTLKKIEGQQEIDK